MIPFNYNAVLINGHSSSSYIFIKISAATSNIAK